MGQLPQDTSHTLGRVGPLRVGGREQKVEVGALGCYHLHERPLVLHPTTDGEGVCGIELPRGHGYQGTEGWGLAQSVEATWKEFLVMWGWAARTGL